MNDMEQYRPRTEQEIAEYQVLVNQQKAEEIQNAKNGKFVFWLIAGLFTAAAIAAAIAS
jgi:hypothetical protein